MWVLARPSACSPIDTSRVTLRSHIRSFGTLGQFLKLPPFAQKCHSAAEVNKVAKPANLAGRKLSGSLGLTENISTKSRIDFIRGRLGLQVIWRFMVLLLQILISKPVENKALWFLNQPHCKGERHLQCINLMWFLKQACRSCDYSHVWYCDKPL